MRIVFLGTPSFAVPTFKKLLSWDKGKMAAVVTQPDRPVGRHQELKVCAVKSAALEASIPVLQPDRLSRSPETIERLKSFKPDILVLVAYGQLLKPEVITLAPLGVLNLHASLLPKYRGAAPINWSIMNGDTVTGVTTMLIDEDMDTGDTFLQRRVPIGPNDTAEDLARTLSQVGADLVVETLEQIVADTAIPKPQNNEQASFAPGLKPELGSINWTKGSQPVHNLVRGLKPWPGTYSYFDDTRIKILSTSLPESNLDLTGYTIPARWAAGLFFTAAGRYFVNCSTGSMDLLEILEVQPENRSRMSAKSWVNGFKEKPGVTLGVFSSVVQ